MEEPESIKLRISNAPKTNEDDKRLIGFVVGKDELPGGVSSFSTLLEQYCVLFLQTKGYTVKKKKVNNRLTTEDRHANIN